MWQTSKRQTFDSLSSSATVESKGKTFDASSSSATVEKTLAQRPERRQAAMQANTQSENRKANSETNAETNREKTLQQWTRETQRWWSWSNQPKQERNGDKQANSHMPLCKPTHKKQLAKQTTPRQTKRQTKRQTDKHTYRQRDKGATGKHRNTVSDWQTEKPNKQRK